MDGTRAAKLGLILAGIATITGFAGWAMTRGLAGAWTGAALLAIGAYALCGYASFAPRGRWPATIGAAALTLAIAWVSFTHLGLLLAGLAIAAGCAPPGQERPWLAAPQKNPRTREPKNPR